MTALMMTALMMTALIATAFIVRARLRDEEAAQTTAEYALVILGAAALATLLIAWVGRADAVGRLFDVVVERVVRAAS